jgi:hypothetical protein
MHEHKPKYDILKGHRRTDGREKPLEELEMEYVRLTDKLIHHMTHGINFHTPEHEIIHAKPTVVIFLDKSARPVSWLTRELWDTLAPEPGSDEIPTQPDFKFLNIDRKRLRKKLDPNGSGRFDANHFNEEQIIGLRSIFNENHDGSFEAPNHLDNQQIMVVDEVTATGATMEMAQCLLRRAFPTSLVQGEYWMEGLASSGGAIGNADLPIWFNDKIETGRGVADTHPDDSITDYSQLFLSRRFPVPDEKSLLLRRDFKKLATSLGKTVLYLPHNNRDDESQDIRARHLNRMGFEDSMRARRDMLSKAGSSRR